ncbi:MAG: alpha/beta fold hydrolase [Oscillospiraceae bacterium]|nr:alpha/beta fold hydrolase [Oscillospiraceae bacterium]
MEKTKKWAKRMLCISLALMLLSMICVSLIQTGGGKIEVKHMYWETEAGIGISANIYIPATASAENPAPAVVTSHGYLNNKEMQDANAVELSRRGYVVIAVDQPGCGYSDTADYAGQNGNGMNFIAVYQAALELSRLPFVDSTRIGVTGHSMGGMSSTMAVMSDDASENPVISAVLLNCIDAVYTDAPMTIFGILASNAGGNYINLYGNRDVGIIVSKYDEFFHKSTDANGNRVDAPFFFTNNSSDAQSFLHFGQDPTGLDTREVGVFYHEEIDGKDAIRVYFNPAQIHPWSHFSMRSETATISFFEEAFGAPNPIPASNQIWQWKEAFNFVGMVGFVMFIVAFATLMLYTPTFEELRADEVAVAIPTNRKGLRWYWVSAAISTVFGALTFQRVVEWAKGASFAEQPMIFGISVWACLCGVVSILLMFIGYKLNGKDDQVDLAARGVKITGKKLIKTLLLAVIVVAVSYSCVFLADYFCLSDFRIWNVGIKTFNANLLRISLFPHALLFLVFYIAFSVANNSFNFNQIGGKSSFVNNLINTLVGLLPLVVLLGIQYGTYFITGHMPFNDNNANMNYAQLWAFLVIIPGASIVDRKLYRVTKNPYLAGIITGVIVAIISCCNTTSVLP